MPYTENIPPARYKTTQMITGIEIRWQKLNDSEDAFLFRFV